MYHFPHIYVFIKIFMYVCRCEPVSSTMWVQMTAKTRQGYQIPWHWRYRPLDWEPNPSPLQEQTASAPNR